MHAHKMGVWLVLATQMQEVCIYNAVKVTVLRLLPSREGRLQKAFSSLISSNVDLLVNGFSVIYSYIAMTTRHSFCYIIFPL